MASFCTLVLVAAVVSTISSESSWSAHSATLDTSKSNRYIWNWNRHQNEFTCPAMYGRYPHPKSCEYFYECRFGYATLMHCNRGYLYDEASEQCRDWRRVNCRIVDGQRENKDQITEDKQIVTFKCPYIWGTFAHPTDCSKYFVCLYNLPTLHECYGTDLFHDKARKCLHRSRVNCGKRLDRNQIRTSKRPMTQPTTTMNRVEATRKPIQTSTTKIQTTTEDLYPTSKIPASTTVESSARTATAPRIISTTLREIPVITTIVQPITTAETTTLTTTEPISTTTAELKTTTETTTMTTTEPISTTTSELTTTAEITTMTTTEPISTTTAELTTVTILQPSTTTITITTKRTWQPTITTSSPSPDATIRTEIPVTKPNTPPPTDCAKDDLDCIIDDTGDVSGWFDCPKQFGHYPHGSSKQLFIHCDRWNPFVKKCADGTVFSPDYLVCMWDNNRIQ